MYLHELLHSWFKSIMHTWCAWLPWIARSVCEMTLELVKVVCQSTRTQAFLFINYVYIHMYVVKRLGKGLLQQRASIFSCHYTQVLSSNRICNCSLESCANASLKLGGLKRIIDDIHLYRKMSPSSNQFREFHGLLENLRFYESWILHEILLLGYIHVCVYWK